MSPTVTERQAKVRRFSCATSARFNHSVLTRTEKSKIKALMADTSPVGAGTFSTICSRISSIPIPALADAKTASLASSQSHLQSLYARALDLQLVGQSC